MNEELEGYTGIKRPMDSPSPQPLTLERLAKLTRQMQEEDKRPYVEYLSRSEYKARVAAIKLREGDKTGLSNKEPAA